MPLPFIVAGFAAAAAVSTTTAAVGAGGLIAAGVVAAGIAHAAGKQSGIEEGYHDGYTSASEQYEKKFARQVRLFEEDKNLLKSDVEGYRKLCEELLTECNRLKNLAENDSQYKELYDRASQDYDTLTKIA